MVEHAELEILLQDLREFDDEMKEREEEVKTMGYLETRLEILQELYTQFAEAYTSNIRKKKVQQEQNIIDIIKQKYRLGRDIYCMCKGKLRDDMAQLKPNLENTQVDQRLPTVISLNESIQTPPCDTPIFEGGYEAWPSFRDMFTAIYINNPRYKEDINKLFQLRRKVDKEAKAIVESFPLTNASFNLAWEALKTHYENKRMLVNVQMKHLFALPSITTESPTELRHLISSVNDCLSVLTTYDVDVKGWDPILVFFVSKRLPDQTLAIWERTIKDPTQIPSWNDLSNFLTAHYKSLEAIADVRSDPRKTNIKNGGFPFTQKRCSNFHVHTAKMGCKICFGSHGLRTCKKFLKMSITERIEAVRKTNCCYNCLSTEHFSKDCSSDRRCNTCGQRHHSFLHHPGNKNKIQSTTKLNESEKGQHNTYRLPLGKNSNVASSSYSLGDFTSSSNRKASSSNQNLHNESLVPANQNTKTFFNKQNKKILLATVQITVCLNNITYVLRALIDPGSEGSFILQSAVNRLRLKTRATMTSVVGMGSIETGCSNRICSLLVKPRFASNHQVELDLIVLKRLTGFLPSQSIDCSEFPSRLLQLTPLADPDFHTPGAIDIVLGADVYPSILCGGVEREGLTIAQETIFGWIFSGNCSPENNKIVSSFYNHISDATSLDQQSQKFWEVEEVENGKATSDEEVFCEKLYRDTTRRDSDGKYIVNLTFKDEFLLEFSLGVSRNTALNQYVRIEKLFSKSTSLKAKYHEVLQEYLDLGHMTPASSSEIIEDPRSVLSYYLPHHAVLKPESLSTQLRVVFNASSSTSNGTSLNDVLYVGPALQQDLSMIIHRWRKYPFVYTADIAKMYRQIWFNPAQAEFQRLLFRDADLVKDYKLRTVTFGVNCSPYLAIRTLLQLVEDEGSNFPLAAEIVRNDFYVDDALTGGYEIEEVKEGQSQLISLLKSGFPLRKFAANTEALLSEIPKQDRVYEEFLSLDEPTTIKALGLTWNIKTDSFTFSFKPFDTAKSLTKRNVFSNIAKLFDPAGWLAPVVVLAKILMQQIWKDKTDWDEIIKTERLLQWESIVEDLPAIDRINIPRWVCYKPNCQIEYHGFSDASDKAMAAVVYLKVVDDSGRVFVNLVSSKTKVAPVNTICVPRLELCGAVLLSKLVKSVTQGMKCTNFNLYLWTDSTIVLTWIKGSPSRWKTFINRVTVILNNVGNQDWRHVRSAENPADLGSRGLLASELLNNPLWWHGPAWLAKTSEHWPILVPHSPVGDILEERPIQVYVSQIENFDILHRFSSFPRALRVLAYCYRFFYRLHPKYRNKFVDTSVPLSQNEINLVKWKLIENTQSHYFPDEYRCLKENKAISSKSALLSFNPYLYFPYQGSNGVMRSCSRLTHASVSDHSKFPILLPYAGRYSQLFVKYMHDLALHGGNTLMLYLIRLEYWIPKVQQLIKSVVRHCQPCIRHRNQMCKQIMGSLPAERVTFTRPFTHTGIDYAGPFELKVNKGRFVSIKGYVSVFVCFATRAIHLEAVTDLSTDAFVAAFARFVSRRGVPSVVYSDNGTNFVGATTVINKEIKRAIKNATEEAAALYVVKGLEWKFIPPGAPHMGGLWEAGVKSFKHHFRRVVGNEKLTFEEFYTVLTKIEACLNSRPISPMSDDPHDPLPLTPSHFFGGNPTLSMPECESVNPLNLVKRYEKLKAIQQEFCRRWKSEYLRTLHQRTKWKTPQKNIEQGDMVIVKQDNLPPNLWRVGRVIDVSKGSDGRVRIATLKTVQGNIDRAISKLVR